MTGMFGEFFEKSGIHCFGTIPDLWEVLREFIMVIDLCHEMNSVGFAGIEKSYILQMLKSK